ncbi:hypothetical protein LG329_19315 (plasmid) [Virgibacillus necropolis]|uniref:hypothetical protein n=1 Tax=Virgibacillus necropolis TaxID=163877 RepID=UPI00384ACE07
MKIIISDFYKDQIKVLSKANLNDELEYHMFELNCKPSRIFILHPIEALMTNTNLQKTP